MKFHVFKDPGSMFWRWTNFKGCGGFADTQSEAFDAAIQDLTIHYSMEPTA
jgi:hypothetical protein